MRNAFFKILLILLAIAVGMYSVSDNIIRYKTHTDKTTLNAVLTGIPSDKTSINKNTSGRNYYDALNSYEYENLSFWQALAFFAESTDAISYIFTSSTAKSGEEYNSVFLIGYVVISDDEQLYLYVSYGGDNPGNTVYRAKGEVDLSAFDKNDFEKSEIVPDLLHDAGMRLALFCRNYAFLIIALAAVALFCLFFFVRLHKRRKTENDLAYGKGTDDKPV